MNEKLSFRENQLAEYEVLKFLDSFCKENQLTYFLMYGSLLGAVREQGIIPWDDDIDVMMPRPDYDRLLKIIKEKDIMPFKLFEKTLTPGYPHPIARISNQRYKLNFANEIDYGLGVFVDIYPLDGVGDDMKKAKRHVRRSYRNASLCFLTSRKKFGVDNTQSVFRMILKFPAYIWANFWGNSHYISKLNKYCEKYHYETSQYVACVAQPVREKKHENLNIYEKKWFDLTQMKFEEGVFWVPSGFDEILSVSYGDYMTPLPEEQRQVHHSYEAYRLDA